MSHRNLPRSPDSAGPLRGVPTPTCRGKLANIAELVFNDVGAGLAVASAVVPCSDSSSEEIWKDNDESH